MRKKTVKKSFHTRVNVEILKEAKKLADKHKFYFTDYIEVAIKLMNEKFSKIQ